MASPDHIECDFSIHDQVKCSRSSKYENVESISLFMCDKPTKNHLQGLNCTSNYDIPESILILFRSGLFDLSICTLNLKICQSHRDYFGIYWKRTRTVCRYPDHPQTT